MSAVKWVAEAPSNIAWIKYMGKKSEGKNLPINSSLSYSLPYLFTRVEIEKLGNISASSLSKKPSEFIHPKTGDVWEPLLDSDLQRTPFSEKSVFRYLEHFRFLKETWGISGEIYRIRSGNNFSADCGMASSASSFAALTKGAAAAFQDEYPRRWCDTTELTRLSRQGSGSSCRSFFDQWALWQGETASGLELPFENLIHIAALVDTTKKTVSTSEAHKVIESGSLFLGRAERAEARLFELLSALKSQDWEKSFRICFQEFWDMHALFLTATEPFCFLKPQSLACMDAALSDWREQKDGPVPTVDAGANVHFFFRRDQQDLAKSWLTRLYGLQIATMSSLGGKTQTEASKKISLPVE